MNHPDWVYLGTKLPRILNVDPAFKLLEGYVQRGEGRAEDVGNALIARIEREGKPLFVSEENFSIGAFPGLEPGERGGRDSPEQDEGEDAGEREVHR